MFYSLFIYNNVKFLFSYATDLLHLINYINYVATYKKV